MDAPTLHRSSSAIGCMLGQCVGDALGFLVEGHGPAVCGPYVHEVVLPVKIPGLKRCGFGFGQYSDDSQLARECLVAVRQNGGVLNAVVYGLRMALMFQPGAYRIVGYGQATAKACEAMWRGMGVPGACGVVDTTGNGSAMRSAPLGLLYARESTEKVIEVAREMSRLTHASEACQVGAAIIAVATRWAALHRGEAWNAEGFFEELLKVGRWGHRLMSVKKWAEAQYLDAEVFDPVRLRQKVEKVMAWGREVGEQQWDGIACGVKQSVLWAVYCFARYPDDYVRCVGLAIACGGDVDTTAAMAGALCGARVGVEGVPRVWAERVNDKGEWGMSELVRLVEEVVV